MCLLPSFLSSFLLLSPPSLSANPDNSDTLTKPGKEARFLGLFFHPILLASSSWESQACPHTLWLCTQAQFVFPKLLEKPGHRLQNFPQLATLETKSDLLSPPSPESLIPVAMNGIKNTDYLTKKIKTRNDLLRSTLRI